MSLLRAMKAKDGDIIRIRLGEEKCAFAQIFFDGMYLAFFDGCVACDDHPDIIWKMPVAYKNKNDSRAITGKKGRWPIIGHAPLSEDVLSPFYLHNPSLFPLELADGKNKTLEPKKATAEELAGIPRVNGSFPDIEDELRARFLGLPPESHREDGELSLDIQRYLHSCSKNNKWVSGEFGTMLHEEVLDWMSGQLNQSERLEAFQEIFQEGHGSTIDLGRGREILAACEILLAFVGKSRLGVMAVADNWFEHLHEMELSRDKGFRSEARLLVPDAIRALNHVFSPRSELWKQMAKEDKQVFVGWQDGLQDLRSRLASLVLPVKEKALSQGNQWVSGEFGTLSNDQAYDWLNGKLANSSGLDALTAALNQKEASYLEVDEGREILAAAEILLALHGQGREGVEDTVSDWLTVARDQKLAVRSEAIALVPVVITKIERVLADRSELAELMSEQTGEPDPRWLASVRDLQDRLSTL